MIIACTLLDRVWITACIKNVTNHNVDKQTEKETDRQIDKDRDKERKKRTIHKYMYISVSLHNYTIQYKTAELT